jgi:hypothetical protein
MIEESVVKKMREKYNAVHPLLFARSVERARSAGDLFDILESLPSQLPVCWDEQKRRWVTTDDLTLTEQFEFPSE